MLRWLGVQIMAKNRVSTSGVFLLCSPIVTMYTFTCIHANTHVCSRPQHVEMSCDMNSKFVSSFVMVLNKNNLYSVPSWSYSARPLRKHPLTCFHSLSSMDNGKSMESGYYHPFFSNLILTFNLWAKGGTPEKPFDLSDTLFGFAYFTFSQMHWEGFSALHETRLRFLV